jgi:hypothetical protein
MIQFIRVNINNPDAPTERLQTERYYNVNEIASVISCEASGKTLLEVTFTNNDQILLLLEENTGFFRWLVNHAVFKFKVDGNPAQIIALPDRR